MEDPKSNPHLFQQYYKTYKQIQQLTKNIYRIIKLCPENMKFKSSKQYPDNEVKMDDDYETYDNERVMFLHCYADHWVLNWAEGYPLKVKRGYELITVDPQIVIFMYTNIQEYNYLIKKYYDYIEECQDFEDAHLDVEITDV